MPAASAPTFAERITIAEIFEGRALARIPAAMTVLEVVQADSENEASFDLEYEAELLQNVGLSLLRAATELDEESVQRKRAAAVADGR